MKGLDLIACGHYSHDLLISKEKEQIETLGGAVFYVSSFLRHFNIRFNIVSKVGDDFNYFNECATRPQVVRGSKTTRFINDYTTDERQELVDQICIEIGPKDVFPQATVGLICGIINEIPVETAIKIIHQSKYTVCDLQGILRQPQKNQRITYNFLENTPYYEIIDQFTAIKANEKESLFLNIDKLKHKTIIIVTQGEKGATIFYKDQVRYFPTSKVQTKDPTGAGDAFLAGFAYGLIKGLDLDSQMSLANFCGSIAVQAVGVPKLNPSDIKCLIK